MARALVVVGEAVGHRRPSRTRPPGRATQPDAPPAGPTGGSPAGSRPRQGHRLAHGLGVLELVAHDELHQLPSPGPRSASTRERPRRGRPRGSAARRRCRAARDRRGPRAASRRRRRAPRGRDAAAQPTVPVAQPQVLVGGDVARDPRPAGDMSGSSTRSRSAGAEMVDERERAGADLVEQHRLASRRRRDCGGRHARTLGDTSSVQPPANANACRTHSDAYGRPRRATRRPRPLLAAAQRIPVGGDEVQQLTTRLNAMSVSRSA